MIFLPLAFLPLVIGFHSLPLAILYAFACLWFGARVACDARRP